MRSVVTQEDSTESARDLLCLGPARPVTLRSAGVYDSSVIKQWPWRKAEADCTKFIAAPNSSESVPTYSVKGHVPIMFYDRLSELILERGVAFEQGDHDFGLKCACAIAAMLPTEEDWLSVVLHMHQGGKYAEAPRSIGHAL